MKQHYFVLVLAHSLHGRLRRIHVPHHALYVVLGLALFGSVSLFGAVSSYLRMAWKVSNYNTLRSEVETLRTQYKELERQNNQKEEQLASLQVMASEVSLALGLKRRLEGADDISAEGTLIPTYAESIEDYNFLKAASFSRGQRTYARAFQKNIVPSMWPVNGQITSRFGDRSDPLSGEGGFHAGVDLTATMGTPVYAAADGIIEAAQFANRYGRAILIDHGHGMTTLYAHLSNFEIVAGEEVRRGQLIGHSGASGRVSGPHLHFEVRQGGNPVNPARFLSRNAELAQVRPDLPF
ncbi:MAG: peptidoglycan DD-metalloendopeptidase family protein [Bryobacteraceae bacterium]